MVEIYRIGCYISFTLHIYKLYCLILNYDIIATQLNKKNWYIQTLECGFTFRLRRIPSGMFAMGSQNTKDALWRENPIHQVALEEYYIGVHPVTQALWRATKGLDDNPSLSKNEKRPAAKVSWIDIVGNKAAQTTGFLDELNQLTENSRPEGYYYRLPTEAEWECAARAGDDYAYAGSNNLKEVGWFYQNSHNEIKEVGAKKGNGFDLFDMSGNIWEWCSDWVNEDYYEQCFKNGVIKNPQGAAEGRFRVVRGGSWSDEPRHCRVSYRGGDDPTTRDHDLGFRLVLGEK